jgi:hypothetical protein
VRRTVELLEAECGRREKMNEKERERHLRKESWIKSVRKRVRIERAFLA